MHSVIVYYNDWGGKNDVPSSRIPIAFGIRSTTSRRTVSFFNLFFIVFVYIRQFFFPHSTYRRLTLRDVDNDKAIVMITFQLILRPSIRISALYVP